MKILFLQYFDSIQKYLIVVLYNCLSSQKKQFFTFKILMFLIRRVRITFVINRF